jgi:excisionase family DNA binding protein
MKKAPASKQLSSDFLTVTQAAASLKCYRSNIHDAIKRGRLQAHKVGNIKLISRVSLEAYRKSRKRTGRPQKKKTKKS